jgi:hypothetical protein
VQVVLGVGEQCSALGIALYSICHHFIHNIELCLGCYAISIVYRSMLCLIMSYAKDMVRPNDLGMDVGPLCFWACSSVLLVHLKGGRPGDARVVTSYTGVVLRYAGSFGYDHAPWCDWGRRQVVTALPIHHNSCVAISALPDDQVQCRSLCKDVTGLDVLRCGTFSTVSHFPNTYSPNHVLT